MCLIPCAFITFRIMCAYYLVLTTLYLHYQQNFIIVLTILCLYYQQNFSIVLTTLCFKYQHNFISMLTALCLQYEQNVISRLLLRQYLQFISISPRGPGKHRHRQQQQPSPSTLGEFSQTKISNVPSILQYGSRILVVGLLPCAFITTTVLVEFYQSAPLLR